MVVTMKTEKVKNSLFLTSFKNGENLFITASNSDSEDSRGLTFFTARRVYQVITLRSYRSCQILLRPS